MKQASAMKFKSVPKSTTHFSPRVSFTTDAALSTPRQSPFKSNLSTL